MIQDLLVPPQPEYEIQRVKRLEDQGKRFVQDLQSIPRKLKCTIFNFLYNNRIFEKGGL